MKIIKAAIFFSFLLVWIPGFSQDSTAVEWLQPSEETIERLAADDDLVYPMEASDEVSWFRQAIEAIVGFFNWLFSFFTSSGLDPRFTYVIASLIFILVLYLIFRSRFNWVFGKNKSQNFVSHAVETENIHEIDFDVEIQKAVAAGDFRLAVRLEYLSVIKLLSDLQIINYAEGKTNNQYVREMKDAEVKSEFLRLSYHFSYLWYGHFEGSREIWDSAAGERNKINQKLNK